MEGGWTLDESADLAKRLKIEGVDLINCIPGSGVPGVKYPTATGWQVPLAEVGRGRRASNFFVNPGRETRRLRRYRPVSEPIRVDVEHLHKGDFYG